MNRYLKTLIAAMALSAVTACAKKRINIEQSLVDQIITEFTEERLAHYLHGGAPRSNGDVLEKVLSRHSLRVVDFRPAFRRFRPQTEARIMGS